MYFRCCDAAAPKPSPKGRAKGAAVPVLFKVDNLNAICPKRAVVDLLGSLWYYWNIETERVIPILKITFPGDKRRKINKKEFKEALLRGRGCCLQAARSDPERYRDIVLWACRHEVAFDPQCEGSKAWFVYQLIGCYENRQPFLEILLAEMGRFRPDGGWKMLYLAELLSYFAGDGEKRAEAALWRKYEALYAHLMARKRQPRGFFREKNDFAMLCQVLAENAKAMTRIAEDIGRLYREHTLYDGWDFDWLFSKAKRWMGTLKKQAVKSENIAAYIRAGEEEEARIEEMRRCRPEKKTGRLLSVWLQRSGDAETISAHAKAYREEKDPEARAKALEAFVRCPYPDDPQLIIADTKSNCEKLSRTAWHVLEQLRHPAVRTFAREQLKTDPENAWPVFLANYESGDEELLIRMMKAEPVDFACATAWHSYQLDILNMEDHGLKAPAALLHYIYETTYCACCREYAVEQMGRRHLLTEEILEECLLDSNDDTRAYAARCLKRRKR